MPCRARRPLPETGAAPSNRPCEHCASSLRASASPRLRVSRSDARRDAEHAKRCGTMRLLSMAGATPPNKTNLCENCYTCSIFIRSTDRTTFSPYRKAPKRRQRIPALQRHSMHNQRKMKRIDRGRHWHADPDSKRGCIAVGVSAGRRDLQRCQHTTGESE